MQLNAENIEITFTYSFYQRFVNASGMTVWQKITKNSGHENVRGNKRDEWDNILRQ